MILNLLAQNIHFDINRFKNHQLDIASYKKVINSSFTAREDIFESPFKFQSRLWNQSRRFNWYLSNIYIKKNHSDIFKSLKKSRENGGLSSAVQLPRLFEIEKIVKSFKPKNILEFGCGTSSIMFSKLVGYDNFTSLEENKFWAEKMLATCPKDISIDLKVKDRVIEDRDEVVSFYDYKVLKDFELVYVDGPVNNLSDQELDHCKTPIKDPNKSVPNVDVENMWINGIYPKYILIDSRRSTVRRLINLSNARYDIYLKSEYQNHCGIRPISPYLYHTLMIRK